MAVVLNIEEVNGVKVLTQERAWGTHPRHRDRKVPINGVTTLLLENGTEVHACNTCGKLQDSVARVVAHMSSHRQNGYAPLTPLETIKDVLRAVKTAQRSNVDFPFLVARDDLNARGILTASGSEWTRGSVSNIFRRYNDKVRVHVPRQRTATALAASAATVAPPTPISSPFEEPRVVASSPERTTRLKQTAGNVSRFDRLVDTLNDLGQAVVAIDTGWSGLNSRMNGVILLLGEIKKIIEEIGANTPTSDVVARAEAYDRLVAKLTSIGMKVDVD